MFVDASAIVAVLTREAEADAMIRAIAAAEAPLTSAIAVYEAVLAVHRKRPGLSEAQGDVDEFLEVFGITLVSVTAAHARSALDAHGRFGKGRGHPAKLNMGDCFAYAVAKGAGCGLLFKGEDFIHTDIPSAMSAR